MVKIPAELAGNANWKEKMYPGDAWNYRRLTCNCSEYTRLNPVLSAIQEHDGLGLKLIVGGSHLVYGIKATRGEIF